MRRISRAGLFLALAAASQPALSAGTQEPSPATVAEGLVDGAVPRPWDKPQLAVTK